MTVKIVCTSGREYEVEGHNEMSPGSVFVMGANGYCAEFERDALIEALKSELDLYEPLEADWEIALYAA